MSAPADCRRTNVGPWGICGCRRFNSAAGGNFTATACLWSIDSCSRSCSGLSLFAEKGTSKIISSTRQNRLSGELRGEDALSDFPVPPETGLLRRRIFRTEAFIGGTEDAMA